MSFWKAALAILKKDLRAELRTKEVFNSSLAFALLVVVIFSMTFQPTAGQGRELAGGLLWIAFTFSAMLALGRTFAREAPNDCLLGLRMAPISPGAIYTGKLLSNLLFILLLQLLVLPIFAILYNVPVLEHLPELARILLLGSWGLAAVGTTFAAIAASVRLREIMLPVLIFPVLIPLLLSLVEATTAVFLPGEGIVLPATWLRMCLGFDVIFTTASLLLFEYVLEE